MEILTSEQKNIKGNLNMDSLVNVDWLKANLDDPNLRVLECSVIVEKMDDDSMSFISGRGNWEKGHIPGSSYIDLISAFSDASSALPFTRPTVEQFSKEMGSLGIGLNTKVVLYDRGNYNNMWATRIWWTFRSFGFDTVAILDGGWKAWNEAEYPVTTEEYIFPETKFQATPREGIFVDTQEVFKALNDPDTLLIDAMAPKIFNGEIERFARLGHISGAINSPVEEIVKAGAMTFINKDNLQEHFASILGEPDAHQQVILYCGRGIRSTVNAFSLHRLGYKNISVYDGSLAEWTVDDSLPMTTLLE
jgi:thiosulfate/3-mercaptopyruvate sulfurtransferase